jgi:hypothetical protein
MRTAVIFMFVVFLSSLTLAGKALCSTPVMDCSVSAFQGLHLKDVTFGKDVAFISAAITSSATVPEHCSVQGTIWPEIRFAVRLPTTTWNGKFRHTGGGIFDGFIPDTTDSVALGFAAVSTNGGHDTAIPFIDPAHFAYNPPDNSNPNAAQKVIDLGTRAHEEGALLAKKLIKAFYGRGPSRSYWIGCSNGGHEGLMMAQRFPNLFDGILVGSPVANFTGQTLELVWDAQALYGDGWIAPAKIPLVSNAVYNKCDAVDGVADGLIDDPRKCAFDPAKDLPRCAGDVDDGTTCFTTKQVAALKKIYAGAHVPGVGGKFTYLELPLGSESGAMGTVWTAQNGIFDWAESFLKYMVFNPPAGPSYDWRTFNFTNDTDPLRMVASGIVQTQDAQDPNLWPAKQHGAKIIQYHGWADPLVVPAQSYKYYDAVLNTVGEGATKEFYKLYMIPGMGHCGGGVGAFNSTTDLTAMFDAVVDWVEQGTAPGAFTGHGKDNKGADRTRPLCPYPQVARYTGTGSIDEAANFTCVETLRADVTIAPDRLSLTSAKPSTFTAFITPPYQGDWRAVSAVCEGAPATTLTRYGHSYKATFNKEDLIHITAGNNVAFTVTLFVERQGRHCGYDDDTSIVFEGSDVVRVME